MGVVLSTIAHPWSNGFLLWIKNNAIGGFPDGRFRSIANIDLTLLCALRLNPEFADIALMGAVQNAKLAAEIVCQDRVCQLERTSGFELNCMDAGHPP